jgi:hypothetical protein
LRPSFVKEKLLTPVIPPQPKQRELRALYWLLDDIGKGMPSMREQVKNRLNAAPTTKKDFPEGGLNHPPIVSRQ